jgi:hypothetical protein
LILLYEDCKALKRHAEGEFHNFPIQHVDDVIAEEGAIHAGFNAAAGQKGTDFPDAGEDEVLGAVGIMHVARPMPNIEHLASLGKGLKQGIITALTFLLAVETQRRVSPLRPNVVELTSQSTVFPWRNFSSIEMRCKYSSRRLALRRSTLPCWLQFPSAVAPIVFLQNRQRGSSNLRIHA